MRHVLPTAFPAVVVQATLGMAGAIIAEASLSFLGLGVQPPTPSWGTMLDAGRSHLFDAPHLTIFPGLAIATLVLGFNFLGDGLRDRIDPKAGEVDTPTGRRCAEAAPIGFARGRLRAADVLRMLLEQLVEDRHCRIGLARAPARGRELDEERFVV